MMILSRNMTMAIAFAFFMALCLLFASQLAYASAVEPATVRVDSNTLRPGLSLAGEWRFQPGDALGSLAPCSGTDDRRLRHQRPGACGQYSRRHAR